MKIIKKKSIFSAVLFVVLLLVIPPLFKTVRASPPAKKEVQGVTELHIGQTYSLGGGDDLRTQDGVYFKLIDNHRWIMYDRWLSPVKEDEDTTNPTLNINEGTYTKKNGNIYYDNQETGVGLSFLNQDYVKKKITYSDLSPRSDQMEKSEKKNGDIFLYKGRYVTRPYKNPIYQVKGELPNSVNDFIAKYTSNPDLKPK